MVTYHALTTKRDGIVIPGFDTGKTQKLKKNQEKGQNVRVVCTKASGTLHRARRQTGRPRDPGSADVQEAVAGVTRSQLEADTVSPVRSPACVSVTLPPPSGGWLLSHVLLSRGHSRLLRV